MSKRGSAIVSLVVVALGYSLMSVATRWMAESFAPMTQVYMRLVLATVVAALLWGRGIRWNLYLKLDRKDWFSLIIMGTVGYALVVYFVTIGALNTTLLNVSLLYSTVPFWVGIFAYLFFRHRFTLNKTLLVLISMYGVGVVASGKFLPSIGEFGIGEIFTVLSAMSAACYVLARKMLSSMLSDREIALAALVIATLSSWVLVRLMGEPFASPDWWTKDLVVLGLIIGGALNILASYLEVYAFGILDGVAGSQLLLSENIWALILGIVLYSELPTVVQGVGALVIIAAVLQMNRLEAKK